jgi:hypothetical protein
MLVFDPPEGMEFTWGTDRLRIELRADGAGGGWPDSQVPGERGGQLRGPAQRGEVPAGHHIKLDAEPLPRDPLLQVEREKAVVPAGDGMQRDVRPPVERAYIPERAW